MTTPQGQEARGDGPVDRYPGQWIFQDDATHHEKMHHHYAALAKKARAALTSAQERLDAIAAHRPEDCPDFDPYQVVTNMARRARGIEPLDLADLYPDGSPHDRAEAAQERVEAAEACDGCGETNGHALNCPTLPDCGCRDDHVSWCPHFDQPTPPSHPDTAEGAPARSARLLHAGLETRRRSSDVGETGHRPRLSDADQIGDAA